MHRLIWSGLTKPLAWPSRFNGARPIGENVATNDMNIELIEINLFRE